MSNTFEQDRKEKRWIVWSQANSGELYTRSGTGPDYTYTLFGSEGWIKEYESVSFDEAKAHLIELAGTLGLDKVKMTRVVDLYTVMYPIS